MTWNASPVAGALWLVRVFVLVSPVVSLAQTGNVESDPAVISVLPSNYPLSRVRVAARDYPWSAVGLLTMAGGRYVCTGTLIAERYVLTAAHCVLHFRKFPEEINFLAGYEQDRHVAHAKAKRVHVSGEFERLQPSAGAFAHDWALVELEKPIGQRAGYLGWAQFDVGVLAAWGRGAVEFKVSGYRGDRRFVQSADLRCRVTGFTEDEKLVVHRCPIASGDSGGPLLLPYQDELLVVGVAVGVGGKSDIDLQHGEQPRGYAVPSATFQRQLTAFGMGGDLISGLDRLIGRIGKRPE